MTERGQPVRAFPALLAFAMSLLAGPAIGEAVRLELPQSAVVVRSDTDELGHHEIATGPWHEGSVPTREVSGFVQRTIWQMPASEADVESVASGFEGWLREHGYEVVLSCRDRVCGGFDFRHRLDMGQSPEMHVDIGNFRYISATAEDGRHAIAVTVSRGGETVYVHAVRVGDESGQGDRAPRPSVGAENPETPVRDPQEAQSLDLVTELVEHGGVPLDDLTFRSGASDLSGDDYDSLGALAGFLSADPQRRVVLVGHTDSRGGRESNIELSEDRAKAVRRHLVEVLGVDPAQVEATGIGYLSPRASNATAEGREANRRVEVVLLDPG